MFRAATRPALRTPRISLSSHLSCRLKSTEQPTRARWDADLTKQDPILENSPLPTPSNPFTDAVTGIVKDLANTDPSTPTIPQAKPKLSKKDDSPASWIIFHMHCKSSSNNTITCITDPDGVTRGMWSGGTVGFRKGNRESYEAGYQCAIRAFEAAHTICEEGPARRLAVHFKGFGQGREAFKSAILTMEGEKIRDKIVSITDRTPLKIGGTRGKKTARK